MHFLLGDKNISLVLDPQEEGVLLTSGLMRDGVFVPVNLHGAALIPMRRLCSIKGLAQSVEEALLDAVEELRRSD
ncbi:hypothetical protein [Rothia halotolerans]|uniref:hypothetical protein n=1 Tax=Rothia halotolerans TaxID=405770 RepID=UPI00101B6F40|nr:hypothetical protein [Rothia halotolerans]